MVYRELVEKMMATHPSPQTDLRDANDLSHVYLTLAGLYRKAGDAARANGLDGQRVALWQARDSKMPNNPFIQRRLSEVSSK